MKNYVAMRLIESLNIEERDIDLNEIAEGCIGYLVVFDSKEKAQEVFGDNVILEEISWK